MKEKTCFVGLSFGLEAADPGSCGGVSPGEEGGGHGRPCDAAGPRLLALVLLVSAAAAQAAQVDGETQQVEAQAGGRHAAQEHQGLWRQTGSGGVPSQGAFQGVGSQQRTSGMSPSERLASRDAEKPQNIVANDEMMTQLLRLQGVT